MVVTMGVISMLTLSTAVSLGRPIPRLFAWLGDHPVAAWGAAVLVRFVLGQLLVRSGRIVRQNLRREMMSVDDLMAKLREHGVDDLAQVGKAFMEGDGTVTVIRTGDARPSAASQHRRA